MFNMSEAVRPVESVTLKRPLNITRLQHWGQLSCQSQKVGKKNMQRVHTRALSLLSIHTARLLADAFHCFLFPFFPGMQNADETSQPLVHSLRRNCQSNPNICMNTKTHRVQWRMREREGGARDIEKMRERVDRVERAVK